MAFELVRKNEDFSISETAKTLAGNSIWESYSSFWEVISASSDSFGKYLSERIYNYVQNIKDIDLCGLHQLYSIAKELNVEQLFSYDLVYPVEMEKIMNTFSVGRSYLLTSGYMLTNESLSSAYTDYGVNSGRIDDNHFLSGFLEPYLYNHLAENANYSLTGESSGIALQYQGFMDDIYSDPQSVYSETTSADIISECSHTLRNICIRTSYHRETLKTIALKHAMVGTNKSLEKILGEYILRAFTKKSDWRLYVEPSGALKSAEINASYEMESVLPALDDINSYFKFDVIEYYDPTEYLNISADNTVYGNITGCNSKFWENSSYITNSTHTSADITDFFNNIGLSGDYSTVWNTQSGLWELFSSSGYMDNSVLSGMHKKYIGQLSGESPVSNIKNQVFPTIVPQPFLYNLIEKLSDEFPEMLNSLIDTGNISNIINSVNSSGLTIDSWRHFNNEFTGYTTFYERSVNLDYKEQSNSDIDRDGPFYPAALSAYLTASTNLSSAMAPYYSQISRDFITTGLPVNICSQLDYFHSAAYIPNLSGKKIYNYAVDQFNNYYTLYKSDTEITTPGEIWMRFHNHPLSFPLSYGTNSSYDLQQVYMYGGLGLDLDYIITHAYEFGIVDDTVFVIGMDRNFAVKLVVFHCDYVYMPVKKEYKYSIIVDGQDIPRIIDLKSITNYIGHYVYNGYLIFIYINGNMPGDSVNFKFKHYNLSTRKFENLNVEDVNIEGLYPVYIPISEGSYFDMEYEWDNGVDTTPSNWSFYAIPGASGYCLKDGDYLKMVNTSTDTLTGCNIQLYNINYSDESFVGPLRNKVIIVKCNVKSLDVSDGNLWFEIMDNHWGLNSVASNYYSGSGDWEELTANFSVSSSAEWLYIVLRHNNQAGTSYWQTARVYYDTNAVFKLAVSENLVTVMYEADNDNTNSEYVNCIVSVDINKDSLSDSAGKYAVQKWNNFLEYV